MNLLGSALLIGALGLDQTAVGQMLLSQPLVGGALLGWLAGDPASGLLAGALFQFLCLTDLPVGASVPPDTAFAGLVGVASFLHLGRPAGWGELSLLGLLATGFLPVALLARQLDVRVRRANRIWEVLTLRLIEREHFLLAQTAANGGLLFFFLKAFLPALALLGAVALWGGTGLGRFTVAAPAFELFARCIPLLGLSALLAQRRWRRWPAALAAGAAAAVILSRMTA